MPGLAYFLAAAALIAIYFFNTLAARERRRAMEEAAARLGLRFSPGRDRKLARRFKFLDQLRRGSNRYAFNTLSGDWKGHRVAASISSRPNSPASSGSAHGTRSSPTTSATRG